VPIALPQQQSANSQVLANQTAVITGASSGIGSAIAAALAREGVRVYLVARRQEALQEVAGSILEAYPGAQIRSCQADLREQADIERLHSQLLKEAGFLDILIHGASVYLRGALNEVTVEDFDQLYQSNLRAPLLLVKILVPMLEARKGQIVFLNSSTGLRAKAEVGLFAATQHALRALATALRDEVNAREIRVLDMYLGRTATPRIRTLFQNEGRAYRPELLMQPEDVAEMVVASLRLPRTAEVTEIHMRPMRKSY
jgi:NADP-dependent 3-hydroxy acid dehydrogenase YdfG